MRLIMISLALITFVSRSYGQESIYNFIVKDINGNDYQLSDLKGKKVMIVNTASKCGLTPQYKELEELYQMYKDQNFIIVGFPANNFLNQEPGTNEEIQSFCTINYGVSFPMMSKISVKGSDIHPLYQWLTSKELNGTTDSSVKWNFQKFLIDEQGHIFNVISPKTSPLNDEIVNWIKES